MPEIIDEILHSEKWYCTVTDDNCGLKRVVIVDPVYKSKTFIEIWEKEIHIKTNHSDHTYRLFPKGNAVTCEYIGTHRGLLKHKLLPKITPVNNINYLVNNKTDDIYQNEKDHYRSQRLYDEFINDTIPIPFF